MFDTFTRLKVLVDTFEEPIYDVDRDRQNAQIDNFIAAFRKKLDEKIEHLENKDRLVLLLHNVQAKLSFYAGRIHRTIQNLHNSEKKTLLGYMLSSLNTIQEDLFNFYRPYFNRIAFLPAGFVSRDYVALNERVSFVVSRLQDLEIDADLVQLLVDFLKCLERPNDVYIRTWNQFQYLTELVDLLVRFVTTSKEKAGTERLLQLLVGQNFNVIEFYYLILKRIENVKSREPDLESQLVQLETMLYKASTIRQERKFGYNREVRFIGLSICELLEKEIKRIDVKLDNFLIMEANTPVDQLQNHYFKVNVTIEDVMFFFRLLTKCQIIVTRFTARIYAFVNHFIRTKRSDKPSKKYMRNMLGQDKFVSSKTVKAMRSRLLFLVKYIDEHFKDQLNH